MARALVLVLILLGVLPSPAAADGGPWSWPLAGAREVSRAFSPPASAYGAGHRGVDLPASSGAPVRASAAGRVSYAGLLAGRGVVVVTHGALRTTYEPVLASVRVGQEVGRGQVLGRLSGGHAGCPAAACLHWGLRRGEQYLDPVRLVQRGPVRLLPLDGSRGRAGGAAGADGDGVEPAGATARGAAGAPPAALAPAPLDQPSFSLRAAEAPLGAAAVVALVVGIGLLARPRPEPPAPVSGGVAAPAPPPADDTAGGPGSVLDLGAARARRHAAS